MKSWVVAATVFVARMIALPSDAMAQRSLFYAGGFAGSHHEAADFASGTTASGGVTGGVRLTRSFGVEVEASRPTGSFTHAYEGFSTSFADLGATRDEIERLAVYSRFTHQRTVKSTVSVGVFHAREFIPRWSSRLFAGVTNRRVEERSVVTPLRYPAGVDPARLATVRATDERLIVTLGSLTFGGGVAFAANRHLSIAPDLRFDFGSIGDEINNGLRTSVRVLWNF